MFILTVEDEFLISEYLRAILKGVDTEWSQRSTPTSLLRCWKGFAISSLSLPILTCRAQWMGPVGGRNQRPMATDPLDRRDRVRAAKQVRIAP